MRELGGGRADRPALRRRLRRVQAPARASGRRSTILDPAEARDFDADVRERALDVLDRHRPRPRRPAARRRVRLRDGRAARAPARRDDARDAPAHGRLRASRRRRRRRGTRRRRRRATLAARRARRRRARSRWAPTPSRGPTTTSGPRTSSTLAPFRIDTTPVTNARVRASSSTPAATTTRALDRRRVGVAHRGRARSHPQFWTRDADGGWTRRRFGRAEPLPARRAGAARVLVRGRRVRPLGAARGSRPRPSGRAPRRARRSTRANLWRDGPHRFAPDAGRRRDPTRVSALGRARDARRRVGVDRVRLPRLPGVPRRSRTASTPRCSSVPSTRCCAAARGRRTRRAVRTTFRNWDYPIRRQIFAGFRCARATPDPLMCRHLAYLGPPVALSTTCCSTRRTRSCEQAARPRHQTLGRRPTPTAGASRWYDARRHRRPSWYRTVTPMWDDRDVRRRSRDARERRVPRRGPAGVARRHARSDAGNAPFVAGRWLVLAQRHRARLPRRRRRRAARARSSAGATARIEGDADTEVLFALVLDRLDDGRRARRRARDRRARRRSRSPTGRLNLLLTDGARVHGHARRQLAVRAAAPAIVVGAARRRRPGWAEVPDAARSSTTTGPRRIARLRCEGSPMTAATSPSTCTSTRRPRHARCAADVARGPRPRRRRTCRRSGSTTTAARELFDEITRLPEYYPTRAERAILVARADDDRRASRGADTLVELGSGTSEKTRLLLDALARRGHARAASCRST